MRKMNPEVKARWCAELRSGRHNQNMTELYDPKLNSYCCLGVLQHFVLGLSVDKPRNNTLLSKKAAKLAGLPHAREFMFLDVPKTNIQSILASMNSDIPFPEIADWIEENL